MNDLVESSPLLCVATVNGFELGGIHSADVCQILETCACIYESPLFYSQMLKTSMRTTITFFAFNFVQKLFSFCAQLGAIEAVNLKFRCGFVHQLTNALYSKFES